MKKKAAPVKSATTVISESGQWEWVSTADVPTTSPPRTNCAFCGGDQIKTTTEDLRYDVAFKTSTGLDAVIMGVQVTRCRGCEWSESSVSFGEGIKAIEGHYARAAVCAALLKKGARLTAKEVRFLRREVLRWRAAKLAAHMGVTPQVVSRWENKGDIGAMADRMLRLLVNLQMIFVDMDFAVTDKADYTITEIADVAPESRIRVKNIKNVGWTVVEK